MLFACSVAMLTQGCATAPPARTVDTLSGRLALQIIGAPTSRGFSADFDLVGSAERGTLRLTGPLGAALAEARWQPGTAELTTPSGTQTFGSLDEAAHALLGEPVPMAALMDWLRGRAWSGAPSVPSLSGFQQLGWTVDLRQYNEGLLQAQRMGEPTLSVRVRLDRGA